MFKNTSGGTLIIFVAQDLPGCIILQWYVLRKTFPSFQYEPDQNTHTVHLVCSPGATESEQFHPKVTEGVRHRHVATTNSTETGNGTSTQESPETPQSTQQHLTHRSVLHMCWAMDYMYNGTDGMEATSLFSTLLVPIHTGNNLFRPSSKPVNPNYIRVTNVKCVSYATLCCVWADAIWKYVIAKLKRRYDCISNYKKKVNFNSTKK